MEKENIIVSACLLGVNCKYNGGHNYYQKVVDLKEKNVTVTGTADVETLKQAIKDAGYEVK